MKPLDYYSYVVGRGRIKMEIMLVIFFGIITIGAMLARNKEKKDWNGGICSKSGKNWILFDIDSQGGRMYKDGYGNYCDVSYKVDKKANTQSI